MAKKEVENGNETKVKGKDPVTIEYTDKAKFHKPGVKEEVHSILASKLVEKGFAKIVK